VNSPPDTHETEIIRSWHANATQWARAVQSGSIASRKLVTDRAIIDAVSGLRPSRVLDLGCGEGWLARTLGELGIQVTGVDAVPELITEAMRIGGAEFQLQSYADIAGRRWRSAPFDAAVCNFSLLGKESVESLLGTLGAYLEDAGHLIVQTLHPVAACGSNPYRDGWRAGSWQGFGAEFSDPAPWYFRTLESWFSMLQQSGFDVRECREPTAAGAIAPASVIFICSVRA
jgi:2-polyprenyl-3-methyl-5-hydroxy-6-metoxy-1,4-benzoquinol methylase